MIESLAPQMTNVRVVARKIRFSPKGFGWQRPDAVDARKWHWGLEGLQIGLYRLPDREKAVDLFWTLGLPACCPPAGASSWRTEWTIDLQRAGCAELIVLPDADAAGARHAERVAQACRELAEPLPSKILVLPGLAHGSDAFDWLQSHSAAELVSLASAAPYWEPGASERERLARRRELTRLRVARWRARNPKPL